MKRNKASAPTKSNSLVFKTKNVFNKFCESVFLILNCKMG